MTPDVFAEWLRRQDHHIVRTASSFWYDQGPRVYQAFPYHWVIQPTENELLQFMHRHKAFGLRYSTPLGFHTGLISYHAIYESASYDLHSLGKSARKNVRRGLRNCKVEPISFENLAEEGLRLQLDTLDRQNRGLKLAHAAWRKRCLGAADLPGFKAWGALVEGSLAASVITFQMENWCYMLSQQCHRDYLRAHVNNALSFVVTQTMINHSGIHSIFYGLYSLDAPASVDEFKFRMGYIAKPIRQRVVFHPSLVPVINRVSLTVVRNLLRLCPSQSTLAKAEGMVRFYLEGKRPRSEQNLPQCLIDGKREIHGA